jgi:lipoprotein-releasing system permease protein
MYKRLLITKYLRRKLAPLFAAVAVMLCTAMVVIVMSVMGGFLEEFRNAAQKLSGDVIVQGPNQGFEGYEDLRDRLVALPETATVMPMIRAFGLLNFGDNPVPIVTTGVDFAAFDEIVGYGSTLLWDPDELIERMRLPDSDRGRGVAEQMRREHPIDAGRDSEGSGLPEVVIGVEVNPYQRRDEKGDYSLDYSWAGSRAALTVVPITAGGASGTLEPERREVLVVNEFKSGLFDVDTRSVFVPFNTLQRMLKMDQRTGFDASTIDPETGLGGEEVTIPGRTTHLLIGAAEGFTVEAAAAAVNEATLAWAEENQSLYMPWVKTWKEEHRQIIGAVQKEKNLVGFLFGVISLVAIFMVGTTFYTLIQDKTRDIGILRAIGATRLGILGLFVGYGLAIGVIGAGLGVALGAGIVRSLNSVQFFLGHYLGVFSLVAGATLLGLAAGLIVAVVVGFRQRRMMHWIKRLPIVFALLGLIPAAASTALVVGWAAWLNTHVSFVMWDPQTYMFDRIPDRLDPLEVTLIAAGMIVSCVIGSLVPALVASSLEPVETLRYE